MQRTRRRARDVIFNGTDKRKQLGMAEVRLTVDNSDQSLPVKFNEVTITRRLYRSGESQYLLNNSPCRLKDIVELFLDTGVGKGAYAFVSQSEIDAVLSARPEDRRELFEEAAGIKKYRVKKREALRKLESAETNLNRVRDILYELEDQREPLEKQALAARRYLLLEERLHEIEVGMLVAELQKADYELYAGKKERDEDQASLLKFDAELTLAERSGVDIGERLAQTEGEMDSARLGHQGALQSVERTESQLVLMTERGQTAAANQTNLANELADIKDRMAKLADSIQFDLEDREATETEERTRREAWAARKATLNELETAVRDATQEVEARQRDRMRLAQERAGKEAALKAARVRLADSQGRAAKLAEEVQAIAAAVSDVEEREREAAETRDLRAHTRAQLAGQQSEIEAQLQEVRAGQATARTALDTARRAQSEQSARFATLTELQESHEGFYQGVRAVLNAEKRGQIRGHYRAVVDLLSVPEPYRIAIEVALGGSLQDIVTLTEDEAKAGIQWLKQNRAGRATFLPLPLLRPGQRLNVPAGVARDLEANGRAEVVSAVEVVGFDPQFAEVANLLLGRVLVVSDMDTAIAASRKLNGWSKIVTFEGELLTPGGALTGGSLQGRGAHLVGRKGEIDDLKARLPQLKADVERLTAALEASVRSIGELETKRSEIAREESLAASELAAAESARAGAERERVRLVRDRTDRDASVQSLAAHVATLEKEAETLAASLEAGEVENLDADDALTALNDESRALAARRDTCRGEAITLEVEVSRLREKREGLTRSLAGDRATHAALEQQFLQKSAQREAARNQGADATSERERLVAALAAAREHLAGAEKNYGEWRDRRQALLNENFANSNAIKSLTQQRAEVTQNLHAMELRVARLEVQIAQLVERLQEEYNISREEALARPEQTTVDRNTAMEVGRLRRELRGMGQVNTGAVAEFDRLTERYDFLSGQRTDLEKGRELLLATIAEIDDSTRGVFMETFEAVRVEFDKLFVRLFDGGTTKLILTAPNDLLETGIEVIAQPPGKKAQSLALLSGGERALTATALLFAFLAVKPSPFVLLDEVDAPLDGANVEKFTNLVREFSQRSQFLLITHNPTTMEAAPTWYGVTMKEPGVSSILSYRVPQETTIETQPQQAVVLAG